MLDLCFFFFSIKLLTWIRSVIVLHDYHILYLSSSSVVEQKNPYKYHDSGSIASNTFAWVFIWTFFLDIWNSNCGFLPTQLSFQILLLCCRRFFCINYWKISIFTEFEFFSNYYFILKFFTENSILIAKNSAKNVFFCHIFTRNFQYLSTFIK
jgi:hypothetical protein